MRVNEKRTEPQGDHRRSGRALPGAFTYQGSAADPAQASRTFWDGVRRRDHRTKKRPVDRVTQVKTVFIPGCDENVEGWG